MMARKKNKELVKKKILVHLKKKHVHHLNKGKVVHSKKIRHIKHESKKIYDVAVVGAGGTGLAAAMYSGRLGMKTLVLGTSHGAELPIGGVITTTHIVENYPGFVSLSGHELAKKLEDHAREYHVEIVEERVKKIKKGAKYFFVKGEKEKYLAKSIIYATGTVWKKLGVPGEKEFSNKGVSYCALCDGPLFRNKPVAIIGGSDSATKEALLLSEYASKVYIIARRDRLAAEPINLKRVMKHKKIEVLLSTNVVEIKGDQFVNSIVLDKEYKGSKSLDVSVVFVAVGHAPLSELAKKVGVKLTDKGTIITDKEARTNVSGFFAAGDVTDSEFKQLITGVAEGVKAAYHAYRYVIETSK